MTKFSLIDFVDIVSTSGLQKAQRIIEISNRDIYSPVRDYYKFAREQIIKTHKKNLNKENILEISNNVDDTRKLPSYKEISESYFSWWGEQHISWFEPARCSYSINEIDLMINPELGLNIDDQKYLVKLYFKKEPLSQGRIDIITHLMHLNLEDLCEDNVSMAVLDIRREKLMKKRSENPTMYGLIEAEIQYISTIISYNIAA